MEYRYLLKGPLEKVYTLPTTPGKYAAWNSCTWLHFWVSLWFGSVVIGVKWHTLSLCLDCFHLSAKMGGKCFCSKWTHVWDGSGGLPLSHFCGQRIQAGWFYRDLRRTGFWNKNPRASWLPVIESHPPGRGSCSALCYGEKQDKYAKHPEVAKADSCLFNPTLQDLSHCQCLEPAWYCRKLPQSATCCLLSAFFSPLIVHLALHACLPSF